MKKRIIDIMPMGESAFCINYINFVNSMDEEDHLFVIITKKNIPSLKDDGNVIIVPTLQLELLYRFAKDGYSIIMHSFPFPIRTCIIMRKHLLNHISWWVWGHDLYRVQSVRKDYSTLKNRIITALKIIVNVIYAPAIKIAWNCMLRFKLKYLKCFIVCSKCDEDTIIKKIGNKIKIFKSSYTTGYFNEDLDNITVKEKQDDSVMILIGHSSFPFLKHEKYLKKLLVYKSENIKIVIPLSYGDMRYAKRIRNCAKQLFGEKAIILSKPMDFLSYAKFLKGIDIGIFDYNHQSALGNIVLLLLFGKKIYLSKNGILYSGYKKEGINVYDCDEIGKVSFNEFKKLPMSTSEGIKYAKDAFDIIKIRDSYRKIFDYLRIKT
jgi:dTDP-N-acetylfucosamine:lipid II N-acetylfucosaminyltransferase